MRIKVALDELCSKFVPDRKALVKAVQMQEGFVSKKPSHTQFFGGTVTGVEVVRFTDADRAKLFDEFLERDESEVEELLYSLKEEVGGKMVPVIEQAHVRGSDVFNICSVWLIHKFEHAEHLSREDRREAQIRIALYMHYKFLTSLFSQYFKFPADPRVAAATYEKLSRKFSLKQYGSWNATLFAMAEHMVGPNSPHRRCIESMDSDYAIKLYINDMQSRVKGMLKNIYKVFILVHETGKKIASTTSFSEINGEIELMDKVGSLSKYTRYIKSIIHDEEAFIKPELVNIVVKIMHTVPPKMINEALKWTSANYQKTDGAKIDHTVDAVMEHAFDYMAQNREISKNDLAQILERLRGAYMSSRSVDVKLLKARESVEEIVLISTGSKNSNAVASARTAWMLYVVARAHAMRYYSNS